MPTATFTLKGLDELNRKLQRLVQRAPAEAGKTLYREATKIISKAQEYVPVDRGVLRASGHVDLPVVDGSRVSVLMGFGGAAASYALIVHEDMHARHPVGQAKYLERPLLEAIPGITQQLAADYGQIFKDAV